ncbi:MAG: Asd/ArgC dimerization domain-containing protein, partial [Iodobacter sp.]
MAAKPLSLAVVGANSTSGETLLEVLGATSQSFSTFYPLAVTDEGEMVEFRGQDFPIMGVEEFNWEVPDLVVFCGEDPDLAARFAQVAADLGAAVVDLSGGASVPLAEPDARLKRGGVARMPHEVTTILLPVLKALAKAAPFSGLTVTALLSVSQDGKQGIDELSEQTRALFAQSEVQMQHYPKRMAFNLHPSLGAVDEYGATAEENRIIAEV